MGSGEKERLTRGWGKSKEKTRYKILLFCTAKLFIYWPPNVSILYQLKPKVITSQPQLFQIPLI